MNKLFYTLSLVLLCSGLSVAQTLKHDYPTNQVILQITDNEYHLIIEDLDGNTLQNGNFILKNEKLIRHGIWKLYDTNSHKLITKSKYVFGQPTWIRTIIDGKSHYYSEDAIRLRKSEKKLASVN